MEDLDEVLKWSLTREGKREGSMMKKPQGRAKAGPGTCQARDGNEEQGLCKDGVKLAAMTSFFLVFDESRLRGVSPIERVRSAMSL